MDVSDIGKIATRKKLCEDVEKVREKVSRENNRIIELKVAQDTAYWDVQEKLRQLEGNHERLQNNMVEIQMQYESISSKLQDELRLRPETLNKVHSVRALVDVVEDYANRLRGTLAQASEDRDALTSAFTSASRAVNEQREKCALEVTAIKNRYFTILRQLNESAVKEAKEMRISVAQLINSVKDKDVELKQKSDVISSLQFEVNEILNKKNNIEIAAKKCEIQVLDYEHRMEELNAKIRNAEETNKILFDKCSAVETDRNKLRELLDDVKGELLTVTEREANKVAELEMKLSESEALLNDEKEAAKINIEQLTKELNSEQEKFHDLQLEFENYRTESESRSAAANETLSKLMCDLQAELNARCQIEADLKAVATTIQERHEQALKKLQIELAKQKTEYEDLKKENEILQNKNRELQNSVDNMSQRLEYLECPTRPESPRRLQSPHRLESPRPHENPRQLGSLQLPDSPRRPESLHHLESPRSSKSVPRPESEQLPESPRRLKSPQRPESPCLESLRRLQSPRQPENEARFDIYNFQSDSSVDSDTLHAVEVNRRFEALKKRALAGACTDRVAKILGVERNQKVTVANAKAVGINTRVRTGKARRQQLPAQFPSPSPFQKNEGNKKKPGSFF